jgi:GcrA cell cycle regulator
MSGTKYHPQSGWTDERIALLKQRWAEDLTCRAIAAELGGISRNAVIGKARRLGLADRKRTPAAPPARKPAERPPNAPKHPWRNLVRVPPTLVSAVPAQPTQASRRSILDLKAGECRWPHGDPREKENFYFCGAPITALRPYCGPHCALGRKAA